MLTSEQQSEVEANMIQVVETVWEGLLGMGASRNENHDPASCKMFGAVQITGAFEGAVTFGCAPDVATKAAELMYGVPSNELSIEQLQDVLGELANMIGGNVKALLPGPSRLSIPLISEGQELQFLNTKKAAEINFNCDSGPFTVRLHERA